MSYRAQQPEARRYRPLPHAQKTFDPTGRVDVLAFRLIMRGLENFERNRGMQGLSEKLRPAVEAVVSELLPSKPLFRSRRRLC